VNSGKCVRSGVLALIENYRSRHPLAFWTAALLVVAIIWLICAYSLAPALIVKAYSGESLTIFNRLIKGQTQHPLTEYLTRWSGLAGKLSFGFAVLGAYFLLAVVGLTKEATVALNPPSGKVAMSKPRLLLVYGLGAVIFGGALFDLIRDTEHWPFSAYPMFSDIPTNTLSMLRLYGVVQRSPLVEIQLDSNLYLQPFDTSRVADALDHARQENRLDEAVTDCLTRYEALRRAGRHQGPPLVAMRLYQVTWTLDLSARNVDRPDRKEQLTEVEPRREGSD
jgi:hypothetical protein